MSMLTKLERKKTVERLMKYPKGYGYDWGFGPMKNLAIDDCTEAQIASFG